jgi:hypothetical protein
MSLISVVGQRLVMDLRIVDRDTDPNMDVGTTAIREQILCVPDPTVFELDVVPVTPVPAESATAAKSLVGRHLPVDEDEDGGVSARHLVHRRSQTVV